MNEVEKMYENAGIKQLPTCNNCYMLVEYWSNGTYCSTCKDDKDNDKCGMADYNYPPFTAEKQLELIKLLAVWEISIKRILGVWYISVDGLKKNIKLKGDFSEAIAKYINFNWQDLTEEEKQQVKGILE